MANSGGNIHQVDSCLAKFIDLIQIPPGKTLYCLTKIIISKLPILKIKLSFRTLH